VVSSLAWHHVSDLDALLDALCVVAPGGRLFVADLDADGGAYHAMVPGFHGHDGFDRDDLVAMVGRHGCTDVSIGDLWRGERWRADVLVPMSIFFLSARLPA